MFGRRLTVIGFALVLVSPAAVPAASAPDAGRAFEVRPLPPARYGIQTPDADPERQRHIVRAADGVELYVETWLPRAKDGNVPPARVPTVLVITPYVKQGVVGYWTQPALDALVPRGYAYTQMHIRGTGESGGCFQIYSGGLEPDDSARVIEWIGRDAPWSDGTVGTYGKSYYGQSQIAAAGLGDPARVKYLKAMVVMAPVASWYDAEHFDGVPYFLSALYYHTYFYLLDGSLKPGATTTPQRYAEKPGCQPYVTSNQVSLSGDWTEFAESHEARRGVANIRAATLMTHGHQDRGTPPHVQAGLFDRLPATTPKVGLFGVWHHDSPEDHATFGTARDWERADWMPMVYAWYERYLRRRRNTGVARWPRVQVQASDGQWRAEAEWPTTGGPVGQLALGPDALLGVTTPAGATSYDEAGIETQPLGRVGGHAVWTTSPLPDRLELTGQPVLDATVSLSLPDAHLAARLEAVAPDGEILDHTKVEGYRSMRHLDPLVDGRFAQREGKAPPTGAPIRVQLRFYPFDLVVPKGARLRLTLAGSQQHSLGLGEGVFGGPSQPSGLPTTVTVHHSCRHPSVLRFVMPATRPRLLNVREKDEVTTALADDRRRRRVSSDGGGLARRAVCGRGPVRLPHFGARRSGTP